MKYAGIRIIQLTYVLLALVLWPYLSTYVNNPDTFQYINIANEYAAFQFSNALNGYWSPMISWLLLFFPTKGLVAIASFKVLQLLVGLVTLVVWCRIVERLISERFTKRLVQWMAVPFLLDYAFLYLTADLLFMTAILLFLDHFSFAPVWNDKHRAVKAGLLSALLYLSKAFGFPLALALLLVSLAHHRITLTHVIWKNVARGLLVFFATCGIWIAMISHKYGHFTVSEAAVLNMTKEVAPLPGQTVRLPVVYSEGLTAPASTSALSAWEEPMQSVRLTPGHPLTSPEDAVHHAEVVWRNLMSIWYFDFRMQAGSVFLLLLLLVIVLKARNAGFDYPVVFYSLAIITLIYGGYSLVLFHARYSWICTWLMVLVIAYWCTSVTSTLTGFRRTPIVGLLFLTVLLAIKRPVKEILFSEDKQQTAIAIISAISAPFKTMQRTYAEDKQMFEDAAALNALDGPLASRYSAGMDRPRYFSSLLVAQSCGQPYFGQVDDTKHEVLQEMEKAGARYFLVYDTTAGPCFGESASHSLSRIKVFRLDSSAKP